MDKQALIDMLNQDLADEHVSVTRYLTHAYQAGEDTPLGAFMLSMAREEMWHMDWLADEIGEMGAEPNMKQGVYPHDPTSNASLLRSYIAWEENLVKMYMAQAARVDKADVKRILMQQSKESAVHAKRFAAMLAKLGPEAEEPLAIEESGAFSPELTQRMESEMQGEYQLVLQHLRHAFVFEETSCPVASGLELTAMRHMKHLSNFAEELAEAGRDLAFVLPEIDMSGSVAPALEADIELTDQARKRFIDLIQDPELDEHPGLQTELEQIIYQEEFLGEDLKGMRGEVEEPEEAPADSTLAPEPAPEPTPTPEPELAPEPGPESDKPAGLTVGSLIKND
jgi:bacterioferritin